MRFVTNLLPQLRAATTSGPHFSRVLSILGAGHEGSVNMNDLELKNSFSGAKCANHSITMADFMVEELALREPAISFIHSSPGVVNTGIGRELPIWLRVPLKVVSPIFKPLFNPIDETGQRQLFIATSGLYPPADSTQITPNTFSTGIPISKGSTVSVGSNGKVGSGAYLVNWDGNITGNQSLLSQYREQGFGKTVWDHTNGIFARVQKLNEERSK
jgi:hypothetical protein